MLTRSRVRSEFLQHEVVLEEFGGDVLSVEVSAKNLLNLDLLEEKILLQAEVLDLKIKSKSPCRRRRH
jgi:translation initiation factor IF-2